MNIRFSSDDVRLRISHQEALALKELKNIKETFSLPDTTLSLSIKLSPDLSTSATFIYNNDSFSVSLRETDFEELLKSRPSRDASIVQELNCEEKKLFIFEIDLFSRKGIKKT